MVFSVDAFQLTVFWVFTQWSTETFFRQVGINTFLQKICKKSHMTRCKNSEHHHLDATWEKENE
jgi:hypothetical protein